MEQSEKENELSGAIGEIEATPAESIGNEQPNEMQTITINVQQPQPFLIAFDAMFDGFKAKPVTWSVDDPFFGFMPNESGGETLMCFPADKTQPPFPAQIQHSMKSVQWWILGYQIAEVDQTEEQATEAVVQE